MTLCPGDVLYVPHQWWHHVISLSPWSVSVNTWTPLSTDHRTRVGEALVRFQVANIVTRVQDTLLRSEKENIFDIIQHTYFRQQILNPNEDDLVDEDPDALANLVEETVRLAKIYNKDDSSDFDNIKFTAGAEPLKPVKLKIPQSTFNNSDNDLYDNPTVKIINSLTEQSVIEKAVNNLFQL